MEGIKTTLFLWYYWLSKLAVGLWMLLVTTVWKINGVARKWKDICDGRETKHQAQVLHIWYATTFMVEITGYNLFTTHEHFAPASIVLRPNVHLFSIEADVAKFVEMEPTIEPLNIRKNPILRITQKLNARKIIILPRRVFDQLMDDVDTEEQEVVWLFHSTRCGSTLWAQIFDTLPNWTVISGTQVMWYSLACAGHWNDIDEFAKTKEFEDMVVLFVKAYLRLVPKGNYVFWRALGFTSEHIIPTIHKRFPKHRLMICYRDVLPSAKSFHRLAGSMPLYECLLGHVKRDFSNPYPADDSRFFRLFWTSGGFCLKTCRRAVIKSDIQPIVFEWYVLQWAARMRKFIDHQSAGIPFKCVKYDSFLTDAKSTISRMFEYLGISLDSVESALKALELDSQAGLVFDHEKRKQLGAWTRTADAVNRCNVLLQEFGLSDLDSVLTLPDTF